MNNEIAESIDFIFNEGMKKESILILEGIYRRVKNYQDISAISPTNSGIFLISELERTKYIKRSNAEKTFELDAKGLAYLVSRKLVDIEQEDAKQGDVKVKSLVKEEAPVSA